MMPSQGISAGASSAPTVWKFYLVGSPTPPTGLHGLLMNRRALFTVVVASPSVYCRIAGYNARYRPEPLGEFGGERMCYGATVDR